MATIYSPKRTDSLIN